MCAAEYDLFLKVRNQRTKRRNEIIVIVSESRSQTQSKSVKSDGEEKRAPPRRSEQRRSPCQARSLRGTLWYIHTYIYDAIHLLVFKDLFGFSVFVVLFFCSNSCMFIVKLIPVCLLVLGFGVFLR